MKVERLVDWGASGLDEAAWDRLLDRSATNVPFLTWKFQTAWWQAFAVGELCLLGVRDDDGQWAGAVPLYELATPEGPVLRLVGGVDVADYLDLIASRGAEAEVWAAVLGALGDTGWRALDLRPIPAASPTAAVLPRLANAAGLDCRVTREDVCPAIELPASWDEYLARLPGKDRHELRRKLRRAERGGARVEVTRTPAGVALLMDGFLALHRKSKVGKARFMDKGMEVFFRRMGVALAGEGSVALWLLWLEGRPAASVFCFERAGAVGLYNSGFDPEMQALSPGVVLIARTIEDAIARGCRAYDFLRGDEPYKGNFGAVLTDVLRILVERR